MFLFRFFFFEHTRPAASMRPPCLIYLSTSIEGRVLDIFVVLVYAVCSKNFYVLDFCDHIHDLKSSSLAIFTRYTRT